MQTVALECLIVVVMGIVVGAGELISRYRDDPARLSRSSAAYLYLAVNGGAGALALYFIDAFGYGLGETASGVKRVLLAGFGAIAFFRTALFLTKVGSVEIAIGPSAILQSLLFAIDRAVDRSQAGARATVVTRVMIGVSFAKAQDALPVFCFALMQNVPPAEQQAAAAEIAKLANAEMDEQVRSLSLGLVLINIVGPRVLEEAVRALGGKIKEGP